MLDKLKLSTRLAAGFGMVLLLLAVVAGVSSWQMRALAGNTEAFAGNIVPSLQLQKDIAMSLAAVRRWELRHVVSDSSTEMDAMEVEAAKEHKALAAAIARYEKEMLVDDEDRRHLERTRAAVDAYLASWDKVRIASRRTAQDPSDKEAKAALGVGMKVYQAA